METTIGNKGNARFDARLSMDKKLVIEKAAMLAGYRNLSDFVVSTVYEKARDIIQKSESILVSQRDSELFFQALVNPPEPNEALKAAVRDFKESDPK
jgi:uncharacterized protein (DUF1778 family)